MEAGKVKMHQVIPVPKGQRQGDITFVNPDMVKRSVLMTEIEYADYLAKVRHDVTPSEQSK